MKRRITSHDVAKAAGVSQSAVSLVLSGRTDARIPDATRERVFAAARDLNYRPNSVARTLVTGRTHRIGIVASSPFAFVHPENYYREVLGGVMRGVLHCNQNLLFHSAQYPNDAALCADILSGGTDGVLLVGRERGDSLTNSLLDADFPTVCLSYIPNRPVFYAVDCENETGAHLAVTHLLELGHRRIGLTRTASPSSWQDEREAGAARAVAESGFVNAEIVFLSERDPDNALNLLAEVLRLRAENPPLTALIFGDESAPQRLAESLPAHGIRVPEDFSVISFNSTPASERTRPPLTSIYQPLEEIAFAAVALLVDLIEGREPEPGVRRFPVRLDVRESTGPVMVSGVETGP